MRGATYHEQPSRPFRSASIPRTMYGTATPAAGRRRSPAPTSASTRSPSTTTWTPTSPRWRRSPTSAPRPRTAASSTSSRSSTPTSTTGIDPEILPHYINDNILRCLAGVHQADRPQFLKIVYNGPKALEELTSFDPSLIVGVLGGGAGTTRDCFELLHQGEKYGARVALFGRKINLAEAPLAIVAMMREVVDGNLSPQEAVRAYHGELQKQRIKPQRPAGGGHADHRGRAPAQR